jgi:hypothetical protein
MNSISNNRGFDMNNREEIYKSVTSNLPLWSYQLQRDSKLNVRTRKDLEIHLISLALKDDAFKLDLLANPKAVVEKKLGTKLPEGIEINLLEETETTIYMVLPSNPYEGISELELKNSLEISYEDVALWVLEQQRNTLLDETSSVEIIARTWRDEAFKQELLHNPIMVIEQKLKEKIEEDIKIQIFAETANTLYIVLPKILDNFDFNEDLSNCEMSEVNLPIVIGSDSNTCGITPLRCGSTIETPPPPPPRTPPNFSFCQPF